MAARLASAVSVAAAVPIPTPRVLLDLRFGAACELPMELNWCPQVSAATIISRPLVIESSASAAAAAAAAAAPGAADRAGGALLAWARPLRPAGEPGACVAAALQSVVGLAPGETRAVFRRPAGAAAAEVLPFFVSARAFRFLLRSLALARARSRSLALVGVARGRIDARADARRKAASCPPAQAPTANACDPSQALAPPFQSFDPFCPSLSW